MSLNHYRNRINRKINIKLMLVYFDIVKIFMAIMLLSGVHAHSQTSKKLNSPIADLKIKEFQKVLIIERLWMYGEVWSQELKSKTKTLEKKLTKSQDAKFAPKNSTQITESNLTVDGIPVDNETIAQLKSLQLQLDQLSPSDYENTLQNYSIEDLDSVTRMPDFCLEVLNSINPHLYKSLQPLKPLFMSKNNFRANKIHEAYQALPFRSEKKLENAEKYEPSPSSEIAQIKTLFVSPFLMNGTTESPEDREILLDTDQYLSSRMGLLIWKKAFKEKMELWFSYGDWNDFSRQIDFQNSNLDLLVELQPYSNNYNKIFLAINRNTGNFALVTNLISGEDRFNQFLKSLQKLASQWDIKENLSIHIIGESQKIQHRSVEYWSRILKGLPSIDLALIGQKGAFEGLLSLKHQADYLAQIPELETSNSFLNLTWSEVIKKEKAIKDTFKSVSLNQANPSLPKLEPLRPLIDFSSSSHDWAVYEFFDSKGMPVRVFVVSNGWGDDMIIPTEILNRVSVKEALYMGTAGVFANSEGGSLAKVGSIIMPTSVEEAGQELNFNPSDQKFVSAPIMNLNQTQADTNPANSNWLSNLRSKITVFSKLAQVRTLMDETRSWLKQKSKLAFEAVEVEVARVRGTLASHIPLWVFLIVTDIVGHKESSLAESGGTTKDQKLGILSAWLQKNDLVKVNSFPKDDSKEKLLAKHGETLALAFDELAFQISKSSQSSSVVVDSSQLERFVVWPSEIFGDSWNAKEIPLRMIEGEKNLSPLNSQLGLHYSKIPNSTKLDLYLWLWNQWSLVAEKQGYYVTVSSSGSYNVHWSPHLNQKEQSSPPNYNTGSSYKRPIEKRVNLCTQAFIF